MDEELEQPNKISPESFFEQLTEVRETAEAAQKTSNSNLSLLNSLKTQVDVISSQFKLFKDEKADEDFEEEDRKQKELMDQRAKAQGEKEGEGTSSESGEPEEQEKGLLGSIGDFISNFFGGLVGGVAGLAISGVGTLLNFGSSVVQGAKDLGKDIAERLKGTGDDIKEKGKNILGGLKKTGDDIKEKGKNILGGIKKTYSGIGDAINNFDGRPGSRKTKDKPQEVNATNPESSTFSTDIEYTGRLGPGLKFIVDESSLGPGVTPERAEQHYYKQAIDRLEDKFRQEIIYDDMSRETAIDVYGPESNLYRFKENYNNTLEYGGYELDVGKHYDFVKQSYSSSSKKDKKDNKLMDFVKGGGVAGFLGRKIFGKKDKKDNKLMDFVKGGGVAGFLGRKIFGKKDEEEKGINTYSDGGGEVKEEKKENKIMDFVKGIGDSIRNFDGRPGSRETKENEKEFEKDKKEGKGMTVIQLGQHILDKQAKWNKKYKENPTQSSQRWKTYWDGRLKLFMMRVKDPENLPEKMQLEFTNRAKALQKEKIAPGDESYKIKSGSIDDKGIIQFELKDEYKNENTLEPIIESNNKNLQSNVLQPVDSSGDTMNAIKNLSQSVAAANQNIQILSTQNQIENRSNNQPQTTVPSTPPQVSPAELKNTVAPIPAINILKMNSEKYLSISGNSVMVAS